MTVFDFYDDRALLERLSTGLKRRNQEVIFLVGAPLSAPISPGSRGVPDAEGMIDLIRAEFGGEPLERDALERQLTDSGARRYQAAFSFLQGRRGQQTINEVVCRAVLAAREPGGWWTSIDFASQAAMETACRTLDLDTSGWHLNIGTQCLGSLIAGYPHRFGKILLTTNFDPLLEVSIRRASGNPSSCYRTVLHSDGNLSQTEASGCHVIHLHGYWFGADTLHTARQLNQQRPHLRDSLKSLLRNKLVVVCGYGGWDDIFTSALMEVVRDLTEHPEVLWTFRAHEPVPDLNLGNRLSPGIDRGRVNLYSGIDCNVFFPELLERWSRLENPVPPSTPSQSNPVRVTAALTSHVRNRQQMQTIIEGNDEDRPPVVDICVGRDRELQLLHDSDARVVFLTGMGGQGKSTVAAESFGSAQQNGEYEIFVWRDCKEERERFENQLALVVEKLSQGEISGEDLAKQSAASIVDLLMEFIRGRRVLFTFDNVDHYVNLEAGRMSGTPDVFITAMLRLAEECRAVFTCRPRIAYGSSQVLSVHLEGLSVPATLDLFRQRHADSTRQEIEDAHALTEGHAFWLDLLAIRVVKEHESLRDLVNLIDSKSGLLPEKTLHSIWGALREREQVVLRAMAETVRPETELEIGNYLNDRLTFNKVTRTLNNLRALNLVVVKRPPNGPDLLELHPLVRKFITTNFPQKERLSFINAILKAYRRWMTNHKGELTERPSLLVLQYWTQSAELDITASEYSAAFATLAEVAPSFLGSAYPREFTRVCRRLLEKTDWVSTHAQYKEFEQVIRLHVHILSDLGEYAEVTGILEGYEKTVANKDARYINYCDLRCYSEWVRGDFPTAVDWGERGQSLKTSTGVDTSFDVSHNLALALRDGGHPEAALSLFLHGVKLAEVLNPDELEEVRGGHYYGNIGRCLHFMGQADQALICYQKSALLLEKAPSEHYVNQGFIRAWIGELLLARREVKLAYAFYRAAYLKWEQTSPLRAEQLGLTIDQLKGKITNSGALDDASVRRICLDWILGKYVDTRP
jgi:tetratricopeptide (TPR) repeat protein